MRGFRGCFSLFSYIISRSVHFLRSDLDEAFSVKVGMMCVRQQKIIINTVTKIIR